jgi:hypothetical protein
MRRVRLSGFLVAGAAFFLLFPLGSFGRADTEFTWSGKWNTNFGPMLLKQTGGAVSGSYTHDKGKITNAQVTGNVLKGRWSEAPTYSGPSDAGGFEFKLTAGAKSFNGSWNYEGRSSSSGWSGSCSSGPCFKNGDHQCRRPASAGRVRVDKFRFNGILVRNGKIVSTTFGRGTGRSEDGCKVLGTVTHRDFDPKTGEQQTELLLAISEGLPEPLPDSTRSPNRAQLTYVWAFGVKVVNSDDPTCKYGKTGFMKITEKKLAQNTGSIEMQIYGCGGRHTHEYPNAAVNLGV